MKAARLHAYHQALQVEEVAEPRAPWHFKLLVAAAAAYLGMRGIQGIGWLIQRFL